MTQNENQAASVVLTEMAEAYLAEKAESNGGRIEFERHELIEHLKTWNHQKNTEGARTGATNRFFDSSPNIEKIGHGKYAYTLTQNITFNNLLNELNSCYKKIDNLLSPGIEVINNLTKQDRRLIYNIEYSLDTLNDLIHKVQIDQTGLK